jgi:hypothetical protein
LRLIAKAQRTGRFKWQRRCGEHIGIKADPLRGFCFSLDFRSPIGIRDAFLIFFEIHLTSDWSPS